MTVRPDALRRSRLTLVMLGTLFFAPFIAAWVVYTFFPDVRPSGTTNHGQLITPAKPVPTLTLKNSDGSVADGLFREKWSLVVLGAATCDETCAERLVLIRQVRLALGKDLSRLVRVYIAPDAAARADAEQRLADKHPGLRIVADDGAPGQRASDFFHGGDALAAYLVDPNGNWLMLYSGPLEPKDLLSDLKKLLRLSSIG
jgi:cytochrome oxidase Cu insertion factor (SCO1/SenC/PrrC family)